MRRLLHVLGWWRRPLTRWLVLAAAASGGLLYAAIVLHVVRSFPGTAELPAECGIVFGTAVHPIYDAEGDVVSSRAGPGINRRVSTAAALYKEGLLRRLFLTGGKGEGSAKSEAVVMRDVAIAKGVPASAITIEDRATSTQENLEYTRPLTSECESVVAISDAYHLARIRLLAKFQGWDLPTVPARGYPGRAFVWRNVLREALGIIYLAVVQPLT